MFILRLRRRVLIFFFNDTATTEIYTLSLHDALPIYKEYNLLDDVAVYKRVSSAPEFILQFLENKRSEEHTSELQSRRDLVCRLLLEKKKIIHSMKPLLLLPVACSLYTLRPFAPSSHS